jgi:DNA-binding beta-propeller fold protein YncE
MAMFRMIRAALGASATLALLAGCSGGNSSAVFSPGGPSVGGQSAQRQIASAGRIDNSLLPPAIARISHEPIATASYIDPRAIGTSLIFVSDAANGVIDIYPLAGKNQKMVGQITGLTQPQGITTDKNGNLYVANTNSSNVLVYAPPYTGAPKMTISEPREFPADVAVSSTGIVAITNICNAPHCRLNTGNVKIYAKGSTKSCATVSDTDFNFTRVMFAEFDKNGVLYIDGMNGGYQTSFGQVFGGCHATSITNLGYIYTVAFPGGIQIDKAGRIAFCDPYRFLVATFDPPVNGAFGNPVSTTPLTGSTLAMGIAILSSGANLYAADAGGSGLAEKYTYPAGGAIKNTIAVGGQPIGIAVTPALLKENN